MTLAFKTTKIFLGMALLCTAMGSMAVTLGRLQGGATVGKPLDVQIQVTLDGGEDASACMAADVFYGDTQLGSAQVTVRVESPASATSMTSSVHVVSPVLVDEPIVSLTLRSGCLQKTSRQYTLFADLPPTTTVVAAAQPPVATMVQAAPPVLTVQPTVTTPRAPTASPPTAAPRVRTQGSAPPKAANRPRLRLDPLDLMLEQDPVLQVSNELLTLPQENAEQRAQAAAWWRALNASPEEVLREAARLQNVQSEIKSLQAIADNNQKRLKDLTEKVQRAESEVYANGLVYSLIALCVASLLALGFLWRRLRQVQAPSWSHGLQGLDEAGDLDAGDSLMADAEPAAEPRKPTVRRAVASEPLPVPAVAATPAEESDGGLDIDLDLSEPVKPAHQPPKDFSISIYPGARAMDTEELLDIRQQADFFMALEQHDKAIELLSTRITQCGESSPLICLDLLKIYHSLGRETEFHFLREEFNHWFTGRVPEFADFLKEGRGLESYPQIMNRIIVLWPEPSVLDYIESCIYHHSGEQQGEDFDLQAYRDLLLLHSIAKRIVRLAGGDDDEHLSEFMRIPASAPGLSDDETPTVTDSRAAAHRAGAHLRGSWNPGSASQDSEDPEAQIETRSSPLGAMRVPAYVTTEPPAPQKEPPDLELELVPADSPSRPTNFDFLGLR